MKKLLLLLFIVLFASIRGKPQEPIIAGYDILATYSEIAPQKTDSAILAKFFLSDAVWDVQFNYNASAGGTGQYGAETNGTSLFTTNWQDSYIHKFNASGLWVESFSITNVTQLRDLAYDGTYFYGGKSTNAIFKMNFTTKTLVSTITCPTGTVVRGIAWDPALSGFWVCDWASDIKCISSTGTVLATIPSTNHMLTSIAGLAYDNYSAGGPFLWAFDQGGNGCNLIQLSLPNGIPTGLFHDVSMDVGQGLPSPQAGGVFVKEGILPGIVTIGGLLQNTPNTLFGYEITTYGAPVENDLGVQYVLAPVSGANLTGTETIQVKIRNYGTTAQSNFPVSYKINGGTPITATVSSSIAGGSTLVYSFTQKANLGRSGRVYTIEAYTSLANDQRLANNSVTKEVFHYATTNQNVIAAEYFINTDPGEGNGTTITGGLNQYDVTLTVNNLSLPVGSRVYLRVKNTDGYWSSPVCYKRLNYYPNTGATLSYAEYFIGTDPGQGNGTQITITNDEININNLNLPVGQKVYLRVKDNLNRWSKPHGYKRPLNIGTQGASLAYAEYFIGADPGQGSGTPITIINDEISINNLNLPVGQRIYIRVRDSFNRWSKPHGYKRPAYLGSSGASLVYGEYFINTDPGQGNGTSVTITDGTISQSDFNLPVGGKIYFRVKDNCGRWSKPAGYKRPVKPTNSGGTLVSGEYFINTDPGIGNGTSLPLVNGVISLPNLHLNRNDRLFMRVKDSFNRWSVATCYKHRYLNMQKAEYRIKLASTGQFTTPELLTLSTPSDTTPSFTGNKNNVTWNANDTVYVRYFTQYGTPSTWKRGMVTFASQDATICQGSSTNLSANGGPNYLWSTGQTTSAITVSPTTTTNYWIKVWNADGASSTDTVTVVVNPLPLLGSSITGPAEVCKSTGPFTYTVPPITYANSYQWVLPTGATGTSTTNSISVTYGTSAVSGNLRVRGVNSCGNGPYRNLAITVNSSVPGSAGTITGSVSICTGSTPVTYTVPVISNASSYIWTLPAGATGSSITNSINVTFPSGSVSGNITVKGHNTCGDGTPSSLAVSVNSIPLSAGNISGNKIVYLGQTGVIYVVPAVQYATSYVWTLPQGASITAGQNTNSITVSFGMNAVSGNISVYGVSPCGNGIPSPLFDVIVLPPRVMLTAFLEGPFNGTVMNTTLNIAGIIPLSQPFNQPPWNYTGTESVIAIPNQDIVDWIMIEFRDAQSASGATGSTTISKQAAFITKNGAVVGLDGISPINFSGTVIHNLYAVIWHRSHLAVMSGNPLLASDGFYTYNFTVQANAAYGGLMGHKLIAPGIWGMVAGDGDANKVINDLDHDPAWTIQVGKSGYNKADYNLDAQINNSDKNERWLPNLGKQSQVPN